MCDNLKHNSLYTLYDTHKMSPPIGSKVHAQSYIVDQNMCLSVVSPRYEVHMHVKCITHKNNRTLTFT